MPVIVMLHYKPDPVYAYDFSTKIKNKINITVLWERKIIIGAISGANLELNIPSTMEPSEILWLSVWCKDYRYSPWTILLVHQKC